MRSLAFLLRSCLMPTIAWSAACVLAGPPSADSVRAVITLLPSCEATGDEVRFVNLARVDSTDPTLKKWIEQLDVIETPADGTSVGVSARRLEYRLRLAGIDQQNFSIRGSRITVTGRPPREFDAIIPTGFPARGNEMREMRSVERRAPMDAVSPDRPSTVKFEFDGDAKALEAAIVSAARVAVLEQLPWKEADVTVKPAPLAERDLKYVTAGTYTLAAQVRASGPPVGRVVVDVTLKSESFSPLEIPVTLDVRHFDSVVRLAKSVARGRTIQRDDLYQFRWDVTGSTGYCTQLDQVLGRVASRPLPELLIVKEQDLEPISAAGGSGTNGQVVIKRQDRVKITVKAGSLEFTDRGEAMQNGRIGERIQVQNLTSKQFVHGRVVSADEVEIEL